MNIKEELKELINAGDYETAYRLLNERAAEWRVYTSDVLFCILAATVYMEAGEREIAFQLISLGLKADPSDYELYLLLGNYYEELNPKQARLCYEQALLYCEDAADREVINDFIAGIDGSESGYPDVSIILVTYNRFEDNKKCIDSIRKTMAADSYELVVVDNASTDGTADWLREQKDIKLIQNNENLGFTMACNIGINAASRDNDLLILHSDTILFAGSVFWLRMGLYSDKAIGACGSMSNRIGNEQQVEDGLNTEEMLRINSPETFPYENKPWLSSVVMLISRKAYDKTGPLDEKFSPGCYEDVDYGLRLNREGFRTVLCHNSFVFHSGGETVLENRRVWEKANHENRQVFIEKWGFEPGYYSMLRKEMLDLIDAPKNAKIEVLELGCALGSTLNHVSYLWPAASVHGIEYNDKLTCLAQNYADIIQGNLDNMDFPWEKEKFDYVICGDVLEHLRDTEALIKRLAPYIKKSGKMIVSLPNIMHVSVIRSMLLKGLFEYQDAGVMDRTHLRFFTANSIATMMDRCGFKITQMSGVDGWKSEEELAFIRKLCDTFPEIKEIWLNSYQYIFVAEFK